MKKECRILQINRMGRKKLSRFILHYVNIDAVFKAIYLFFTTPFRFSSSNKYICSSMYISEVKINKKAEE
ncbi:hypothetical protein CN975_09005 [Bacillus cereus]|nr:hypothetical protein CN343_22530 [Bacillus cereus]PGN35344.1 hypothetical protein CN960_23320 [Bacillus cereus]PGN95265.1 hypothetical protein CN975_09005 [Bacillus cereus]